MASFRFVHTADLHLDSPLKSLALRDPELAAVVGNATRQAMVRIVDLCIDEHVDALLIAGDLYDGDQTSMKTALFLAEQFARLDAAGIRTFVIRGNHDNLSRITRELVLPESVTVFRGVAATVMLRRDDGSPPIAVHGLSFTDAQAPGSLLPKYRQPVAGAINIGLMHTSLGGAPGHDPYAPCAVADLDAHGFAYWALGHIHRRAEYKGAATIVMPGMPQGRDINEEGPKTVSLVEISGDGAVTVEERNTAVAQFRRLEVDVSGTDEWAELVRRAERALSDVRGAIRADHGVLRIAVTGNTPLAWRVRRDADLLKTQLQLQGAQVGRLWIESLEVHCHSPRASAGDGTPVGELHALLTDRILPSEGFVEEARATVAQLMAQLPAESRGAFGDTAEEQAIVLARLAAEGVEDVIAALHGHPAAEVSS
jgi:DNA repair exonuclease SbcCD nuclease subunit